MEVFDPSPPQVRRGGWAEAGWRGRGEAGAVSSARRGAGRLLAPSPCGFVMDGRSARNGAAVWRSRRRQAERLSSSLPRVPAARGQVPVG